MAILGTAKPLASLSSGLLARKGQARPAMRPQGFAAPAPPPAALDDLGWNDMGTPAEAEPPVAPPAVLVERETLAREIATPAPPIDAVSLADATRIGRESATLTKKGLAAFTLRLHADRHLRLRLASAVTNRSAQALVAEALDRFLDTIAEVEALAAQLPQTRVTR